MLKPQATNVKGTGKLAVDDPQAWKGLPGWRKFLLSQEYDGDGGDRQAGVVIFKATGDGWQFTLKDTTSCTMLRVSARTWDEAVLLIEGFLTTAGGPWETDPYEAGKRGRSRGRKA